VLKTAVLERISAFNARLMIHERVTTPAQIVSVPSGSLPRTAVRIYDFYNLANLLIAAQEKGNIRSVKSVTLSLLILIRFA
jgi:hypothetical protein